MIIEVADITLKPGTSDDFDAAVVQAVDVFRKADGCLGLHSQRCIEDPLRYQVVIRWETLQDHIVGFRESALFQQWRALVGPYFAGPPAVLHYEIAMDRVAFSQVLK